MFRIRTVQGKTCVTAFLVRQCLRSLHVVKHTAMSVHSLRTVPGAYTIPDC
jgi:hypothetical protein